MPEDTTAQRVREAIDSRGWSAYRLAQAAGLPQQTVQNVLVGKRAFADVLARIAAALGVGIADLVPPVKIDPTESLPRGRPRSRRDKEESDTDA